LLDVVLDTSVVIAAARSQRGASALLIDWLDSRRFGISVSVKLILEYEKVLRRQTPSTGWSDADITRFVDFMCFRGRLVEPYFKLRPMLRDPNDDFVLELAFAARVDFLVTHNIRDFSGSEVFGVKVVTPSEFVKKLRGFP
jgi:putative PIN family toxin of toxin-antitoxin system